MKYKLKVLKTEDNPDFEEDLRRWREDIRYPRFNSEIQNEPPREFIRNAMEVELTDEQFEAVKKAVIEAFR